MFDELKNGWDYYVRAWPQIVARFRGYSAFVITVLLYCGILFGLSLFFKNSVVSFLLIGLGLFWGALSYLFFKKQIFSVLDANTRAVLAELMTHEKVPLSRFQIRFARKKVVQKFGNRQRIFEVDRRIRKSLYEIFPLLHRKKQKFWIPFQKMRSLNLQYSADLLMGHCFFKKEEILWNNLREGMILYMQNFKKIFKMSFHLYLLTLCFSGAFFMILLPPVLGLSWFLPDFQFYFFFSAMMVTWAFKKIVLDPYAMATLIFGFRKTTKGQSPDPQWDKRLSFVSPSFSEIKKRANYWEQAQLIANTRSIGQSEVVIFQNSSG